jgi:tRNA-uridine 2-sulfurtransferase
VEKSRKKILVAISGGVDSAVSAALLKKQGFDVFGVFFCFFDGKNAKKSLNKAKKVAKVLNIPLKIVDARKEFKKKIVDYFVSSYKKGITPNPCVVCNKEMKFRLLFDLMKEIKADYVATGHYARLGREFSIFNFQFSNNEKISKLENIKLLQAKDKTKDQSYFLYRLTQKELSKTIFPLGELKKTEVKRLAKKFKLPVFGDEESQDVCFLNGSLNNFLKKNLRFEEAGPPASLREQACLRSVAGGGNIVDEKGNILARHKGLPFYTIGQRKGIEIGGTGPYFVISKDSKKNQLVVSNDPKKLLVRKFFVNRVNWVNKGNWGNSGRKYILKAHVQIRYHAPKVSAIIKSEKLGKLIVETKRPLRAVTPGQSAVFYRNSEVLGGGAII